MEQRCYLWAVWLTWLGLPLLAVLAGLRVGWVGAAAVLVAAVVAQVLYIRWFPHVSRWVGYGSVDDVAADAVTTAGLQLPLVTLYTANVCPFCPLVERRLKDLQPRLGFEIEKIDVTFRPEIVRAKGLRSVPVVEANGRLLSGNATSEQLAEFFRDAANSSGAVG